jgi:hypothetical protein
MPITAGVIDQFSVPPLNQLVKSTASPVALSNPYSGSGNLLTVSGGVKAFGLHWAVNSAPSEAGLSGRSILIYAEPYLSFSVHYVLADASDYIGETVLTGDAEGFHLFTTADPASLAYHILPGWTVHLDWLVQP